VTIPFDPIHPPSSSSSLFCQTSASIFPLGGDLLSSAVKRKTARTARVASWDHSGKNEDAFVVLPGESATLCDIEGPGTLTYLWFVQTCRKIMGPGLIPYSKSGVVIIEIYNALGESLQRLCAYNVG